MHAGRDVTGRWLLATRRAAEIPHAPALSAVILAAFAVLEASVRSAPIVGPPHGHEVVQIPFLVLIALATTLPLGLLWSQPRVAAVVLAVANLVSVSLVQSFTLAGVAALLIAVYRLGYRGAQLLAGVIAGSFLVIAFVGGATSSDGSIRVVLAAAVPSVAWAGYARRVRDESATRTAETEAIAGSLLEHTARGERARISRELHDVVAHHISMIAVQAESARLTTPGMPSAGAERLLAIGDTARSALTEMRRLLGVLRADTSTGAPQRQPQPGLDQLNDLLDEMRDASGTATRLIISGQLAPLDPGVELAAYRIVQEALTNVRRHAPGAAVDVELRYDDELYLRIRDNGPGPPAGVPVPASGRDKVSGGHGLLGMRERAVAVGGTLQTGPAPGGGFLVEATFPATAAEDAA